MYIYNSCIPNPLKHKSSQSGSSISSANHPTIFFDFMAWRLRTAHDWLAMYWTMPGIVNTQPSALLYSQLRPLSKIITLTKMCMQGFVTKTADVDDELAEFIKSGLVTLITLSGLAILVANVAGSHVAGDACLFLVARLDGFAGLHWTFPSVTVVRGCRRSSRPASRTANSASPMVWKYPNTCLLPACIDWTWAKSRIIIKMQ